MLSSPLSRRLVRALLLLGILASWPLQTASATSTDVMLTLKPHCILDTIESCPTYTVRDAQTLETGVLQSGDILDIDIVLSVPDHQTVNTVRAWLEFDPQALEARSVDVTPAIGSPLPGEQSFDNAAGLIKVGGTVAALRTAQTAIARVTFRVIGKSSVVRFHHYRADGSAETAVLQEQGSTTSTLLHTEPSALAVQTTQGIVQGSASSTLYGRNPLLVGSASAASSASTANVISAFSLLQVQNVRVTSKDTQILLGWDVLRSSELAGYNVYYSTVSGRYLQRRSIAAASQSLVIRDLDPGVQYFLAVRGVNQSGQETAFSQEVAVIVGRAETSTSPLSSTAGLQNPPVQGNPIDTRGGIVVTGQTGVSDIILWLSLASALIGTGFAWRKQTLLFPHKP